MYMPTDYASLHKAWHKLYRNEVVGMFYTQGRETEVHCDRKCISTLLQVEKLSINGIDRVNAG